ncbi:hypothetical protein ACLOJK_002068 [Asimina triloba]
MDFRHQPKQNLNRLSLASFPRRRRGERSAAAGERAATAMDPDTVAKAFVEHYYRAFDADRSSLVGLYEEGSMLTFEGQKIQGAQNIVAKLTSLPFQQCHHSISTVDCQPSGPAGGMLVFVSGNLQLAGEQHALKFSQVEIFIGFLLESTIEISDVQSHEILYAWNFQLQRYGPRAL